MNSFNKTEAAIFTIKQNILGLSLISDYFVSRLALVNVNWSDLPLKQCLAQSIERRIGYSSVRGLSTTGSGKLSLWSLIPDQALGPVQLSLTADSCEEADSRLSSKEARTGEPRNGCKSVKNDVKSNKQKANKLNTNRQCSKSPQLCHKYLRCKRTQYLATRHRNTGYCFSSLSKCIKGWLLRKFI